MPSERALWLLSACSLFYCQVCCMYLNHPQSLVSRLANNSILSVNATGPNGWLDKNSTASDLTIEVENIKFFISSIGDERHLSGPEVFVAITDAVARVAVVEQRKYIGEFIFVDEAYPKTGINFTSAKTGPFDSETVMLTLKEMFTYGMAKGEQFEGLKCAVSVDNQIIGFGVLHIPETSSESFNNTILPAQVLDSENASSTPEQSVSFSTRGVLIAPEYTGGVVFKTEDFLLVIIDWLIQVASENKMARVRDSRKIRSVLYNFTLCFSPISVMKSFDFHLWIGIQAVRGVIRWLYDQRLRRPNFVAEFRSPIKYEGKIIGSIFLTHGRAQSVIEGQPLSLPTAVV